MSGLLYTTLQVQADTPITHPVSRAVRVGHMGHDLLILGEPDDLTRLADALHEAAASLEETA